MMKSMKTNLSLIALIVLIGTQTMAGLLMPYHKLAVKDLDQMNKLVADKIKESKKASDGKIVPLKEALQAVLARPNEDGMIDKVLTPLKNEIDDHDAWEKTIEQLTTEALNALKMTKNFKGDAQVSYAIFLENLIAELKPSAHKEGFEKKTLERIRDAKIKLSKEAQKERKLRLMKSPVSPSEIAEMVLTSTKVQENPTPDPAETPEAE